MVEFDKHPHMPKVSREVHTIPKFPWKSWDPNPLVDSSDGCAIRVKQRNPRQEHEIQTINKPRSLIIHHKLVLAISKPEQNPIIAKVNIFKLPLNKFSIILSAVNNSRKGNRFSPDFPQQAIGDKSL